MNLKYVFACIILTTLFSSCKTLSLEQIQTSQKTESLALQKKIYQSSMAYGDPFVATQAVHTLLAIDSTNYTWQDTLALLYLNQNRYVQAVITARESLKRDKANKSMLETEAIALQNLGSSKEALESYEGLYKLSQNIQHLYQIANLQYLLKRIKECQYSCSQILAHPDIDKPTSKVSLYHEKGSQEVPIKAASYNILGYMQQELSQKEDAKKYYQKALEVFPEFEYAKTNLSKMDEVKNPKGILPEKK